MRWVSTAAASLLLLLSPALFGRLILGAELSEPGQALGSFTGIALLGFRVGVLAEAGHKLHSGDVRLQSARNSLPQLSRLGIEGMGAGMLLWPAVALHLLLTALLAADHLSAKRE